MTDTAIITPDGVSATAQTVENSYVAPDERVLDLSLIHISEPTRPY